MLQNSPERLFNHALLRERRARALHRADFPDFLHARIADEIAGRLSAITRVLEPAVLYGAAVPAVRARIRRSGQLPRVVHADEVPATGLDIVCSQGLVPFAAASLGAILVPLGLELGNDLPGALIQMRRALKPDGLLLAVLLGGDTLTELRQAWVAAESEISGGVSPRVAPFADVRELGGLLQRAGFALPVADSDRLTVRYPSALALMRELKSMGLANPLAARSRRPVTRSLLARAAQAYEDRFSDSDGRIHATFELVTLTAWSRSQSQPQPLRPGTAQARLAQALGTVEHKLKR
jgi:hypothetical protein